MTWKKDLAKLKQSLDKEETPPAKAAPPPRAKAPEGGPKSMEEEDQVFLAAMGLRARPATAAPAAAPRPEPAPAQLVPPPPAPSAAGEFTAAMGDLKGVKPMRPGSAGTAAQAPASAPVPAPASSRAAVPALVAPAPGTTAPAPAAAAPAPEPPPAPAQALEPAPGPSAPPPPAVDAGKPAGPPQVQIQLAAGMAVVVDGRLDLKGHGRGDAEERLKERLEDGYALGWRTLHVVVGPSPDLRQMVLDLLASPAGRCVARYAQAPVPMGGAQAWILYFHSQNSSEN